MDPAFHIEGKKRKRLYIDLPCKKCGDTRPVPKHNVHPGLCRRCSYESRTSGPVKFICKGDSPYRTTLPLDKRSHADGCPWLPGEPGTHGTWKARKRVTDAERYNTDLDETRGLYRSKPSASPVNRVRQRETFVMAFLEGKKEELKRISIYRSDESKERFKEVTGLGPSDPVPRIESRTQLERLEAACRTLGSYKDKDGVDHFFDVLRPYAFKPGPKTVRTVSPAARLSQSIGLLVSYWQRKVLPKTVRGLCLFCEQIVLSVKPDPAPRVHAKCYQDHWGHDKFRHGIPDIGRRPGGQATRESLTIRWAWTIRHKLGDDSLEEIAKEFGVTKQTVAEGIEFIMDHLPDPAKVAPKFRKQILLLQAAKTA